MAIVMCYGRPLVCLSSVVRDTQAAASGSGCVHFVLDVCSSLYEVFNDRGIYIIIILYICETGYAEINLE